MISIHNLSVTYDIIKHGCVLENISLDIATGSSCVIIGKSGSGKSTLLKVLAGLLKGCTGSVLFDGIPVDARKHTIGYLPQNYGLLPWLTIKENILLGNDFKRNDASLQDDYIDLVQMLGLNNFEQRYPHEVSGGQKQRAALARVFLLRPQVLLLDEPFSALDALTRDEMQKLFFSLWQRYKITAVIVTHYVEEALYLGQNIVVMSGKPGQIIKTYNNDFWGLDNKHDKVNYSRFEQELRLQLKDKG